MANNIITGVRANNEMHLGNYLGGVLPMINIQKNMGQDDKFYMFVPDLHSFTTPIDHSKLYESSLNNIRSFVAAGIDPDHENTFFFRQSQISPHAELAWILNCFTYFGEASRMTEFKDKSAKLGGEAVSIGLFDYPVLMAADILLYHANYIPLGDDQKQHIELTRTIAQRFNNKFEEEIFTVPEEWKKQLEFSGRDLSVRIMSLSNPEKKMSKSVDDPRGTIQLNDDPSSAHDKVMKATTDDLASVDYSPETQPGISNLLVIYSLLSGKSMQELLKEWKGKNNYGDLKNVVAKSVSDFLVSFQSNLEKINPDRAHEILKLGEQQVRPTAQATLERAQKAVGLVS